MTTILELPEHLVSELQLRAAREGRGIAEVIGDLLAAQTPDACVPASKRQVDSELPPTIPVRSIGSPPANADDVPRIITDSITGLPVIVCTRTPPPDEELTQDRIAAILHGQEVEWFNATP
jgi:plasmid stability protein